jgi:hypothetical protein
MRRRRPSGSCTVAAARLHKPYRTAARSAGGDALSPFPTYRAISYGLVAGRDQGPGGPARGSGSAGFYDTSCSLRAHGVRLAGRKLLHGPPFPARRRGR